jgi:hypothetical protein
LVALWLLSDVAAVTSYLLRARGRWVALGGAGAALLAAAWIWSLDLSLPLWVLPTGGTVDLEAPITFAGYTFRLQAHNAPVIAIYLLITALALLIHTQHRADDAFPALAWLIVSGYSALALLTGAPVAPVIVAPLLLIMLTALSIYALQGERATRFNGALRTLLAPVLAAPLFLDWRLVDRTDSAQPTRPDGHTECRRTADGGRAAAVGALSAARRLACRG